MNIGICTVHYAHNYGAMLQAFALKTYLESLGHHVVMTDRRTKKHTTWNPKSWKKESLKGKLLYPKYLWKWYLPSYFVCKRRDWSFTYFLKKYIDNEPYKIGTHLDAIIYGSDQIWAKFDPGFDDIFWGIQNSNTNKRIAYATSMGIVHITDEDESYIRDALSRFDAVSVREMILKKELDNRKLYATEVNCMIDPAFLIGQQEWVKIAAKRQYYEPYLLFYDFQLDPETTKIANKIASEKKIKIIRLTEGVVTAQKEKGYLPSAGPREFISLFQFADFVVSSSFHGVAFSIIFNKQFYARQVWNTDRVKSLLSLFGLSKRFIQCVDDINLCDEIDYEIINNIIEKKRTEGINFLLRSLA